jgi:uncharacterized protein
MIYLPPMDSPPPEDLPPDVPMLLPAADLPPMGGAEARSVPVLRSATHTRQNRRLLIAAAIGLLVVAVGVLGFFQREVWVFLGLGAIVPIVALLPVVAYVGERQFVARVIALLLWLGITLLAAALSVQTVADATPQGETIRTVLAAGGVVLAVVLGLLCFMPRVREFAARHLPFDAGSFVQAVGLGSVVALSIILFVPQLALGGPPALDKEAMQKSLAQLQQFPPGFILRLISYAYFWIIASELTFVGFPVARSLGASLKRLGLVVPTIRQVAFALFAAVALLVITTGVERVIAQIWDWMHWPRTDEKSFNELMSYAISPVGALVIGVVAGLSEEIAFRGVLQPRVGILLSNLLFTAAHAFQYNWDGLLSVFLIGLVLALIRRRFNTTTSAIVHGTYDCLAVFLTYLTMHSG